MGLYRRNKTFWMSFIDNSGKQHQKSTGTADRKLAEQILHKVQTMVIEGKWFDFDSATKHNYDELVERFIKDHSPSVSDSMEKSYRNSRAHLDPFFSGLTLNRIDGDVISQYVAHRRSEGCRPATRNRELAMLSKMFNLARVWKWVRENPCELIPREKEDNDIGRVLTDEEETLLREKATGLCNGDLPDIILLGLHTGFRIGQIPYLKWSDIDFQQRSIKSINEKVRRPYSIPMSDALSIMLQRRSKVQHISGLVFPSQAGTPLDKNNIRRAFRLALDAAGIKGFRFHDIRHSAASRLARAGVDIYAIASFLNQSQISTTKRYAKHNTESLRNVVKVFDLKNGTVG